MRNSFSINKTLIFPAILGGIAIILQIWFPPKPSDAGSQAVLASPPAIQAHVAEGQDTSQSKGQNQPVTLKQAQPSQEDSAVERPGALPVKQQEK